MRELILDTHSHKNKLTFFSFQSQPPDTSHCSHPTVSQTLGNPFFSILTQSITRWFKKRNWEIPSWDFGDTTKWAIQMLQVTILHPVLLGTSMATSILKVFLYLKAQNSSWSIERVLCLRDQVFPLLFPIHTSKPASARMKPRLLLGRLEIQLLASPRRPCCSSTTGLDPADRRKFQLGWNVLCSSCFLYKQGLACQKSMCRSFCCRLLVGLSFDLLKLFCVLISLPPENSCVFFLIHPL